MKKEQIEILVTVAGVVIFGIIVAGNLKKKPAASAPAPSSAPAAVMPAPAGHAEAAVASPVSSDTRAEQLKRSLLPWKRNPFISASTASAELETLKLKGISFGPDGRGFVSINDVIVGVGETIADFQVKEVHKDKVLLEKGSQSFYLAFPDDTTH